MFTILVLAVAALIAWNLAMWRSLDCERKRLDRLEFDIENNHRRIGKVEGKMKSRPRIIFDDGL